MTVQDILRIRLFNQRLIGGKFDNPAEAVRWFGAVQSQDFPGAKWAVGQRVYDATDQILEEAFTKGEILRTHVMRPTWHFVHPEDIRWMLFLTAPRVKSFLASYNRKLELTEEVFAKSNAIISKALSKNDTLTRQELKEVLAGVGIKTDVQRLAHIVAWAELDARICSGPRRGRQFTYALLDKRAPKSKRLNREEALFELTKRYFTSHGPATLKDFAWWSGLTVADARKGIEMNNQLQAEEVKGKVYFFHNQPSIPNTPDSTTYLLPNYDEYGIAYKEREIFIPEVEYKKPQPKGALLFPHMIVRGGMLAGMWKRVFNKSTTSIVPQFFNKPSEIEYKVFKKAAEKYGKFLNMPVIIN